jgi:hypothetical protein
MGRTNDQEEMRYNDIPVACASQNYSARFTYLEVRPMRRRGHSETVSYLHATLSTDLLYKLSNHYL